MKTLNKAVARYNGISLIVRILIGLFIGAVLALVALKCSDGQGRKQLLLCALNVVALVIQVQLLFAHHANAAGPLHQSRILRHLLRGLH